MPARTSKEPLSRERVLDAALAAADQDGLGTLTMRRVADELDCEAMSLYYYVKDKAGLLSALTAMIIDEVIAETLTDPYPEPDPAELGGVPGTSATDWRTTIRNRCLGARRVMLRHPWAPALVAAESNVPPRTMKIFEALVATMIQAGFDFEIAHRAIHSLGSTTGLHPGTLRTELDRPGHHHRRDDGAGSGLPISQRDGDDPAAQPDRLPECLRHPGRVRVHPHPHPRRTRTPPTLPLTLTTQAKAGPRRSRPPHAQEDSSRAPLSSRPSTTSTRARPPSSAARDQPG